MYRCSASITDIKILSLSNIYSLMWSYLFKCILDIDYRNERKYYHHTCIGFHKKMSKFTFIFELFNMKWHCILTIKINHNINVFNEDKFLCINAIIYYIVLKHMPLTLTIKPKYHKVLNTINKKSYVIPRAN